MTKKSGDRLVLYTGAQVWEGPPKVRPSRKGRYEHGPGIYLTTGLETARKYAKGRGAVLRVEVDSDFVWLQDAVLPTETLVDWVMSQSRLKHRREIVEDLDRAAKRVEDRLGEGMSWVETLVNLTVNREALSGDAGPSLAEFLSDHGIGASLVTNAIGRGEDWVVLFDPSKVITWERVGPNESTWDLPRVRRK